jgi:hypothetical protein
MFSYSAPAPKTSLTVTHPLRKLSGLVTDRALIRSTLYTRELQSGPGSGTEILFFTGTGPGLNLPSGPVNFLGCYFSLIKNL